MNKEIKEILDKYKNMEINELSPKQCNKLLDYITNLQQENEKIKERCNYLQRRCDRKEEQRDDAVMEYMQQDDYRSRNDKAIEIIEKYFKDEGLTMYHDTSQHLYPVLKALKGDDESEEKELPEKINVWYQYNGIDDKELTEIMLKEIKDKINEIIGYLEKQRKGE